MDLFHNEIPLIQKTYDLYKVLHAYTKSFPKADKYVLGERIKTTTLDMLELLMEAETAKKDWKEPILAKVNHKLSVLKLLIRLASETKALDGKKYIDLIERQQEIGRMIGGWIKSVR